MTKENNKASTNKNKNSSTNNNQNKISTSFLVFLFILPHIGIPLLWILSDNVDKSKKINLSIFSIIFFTVYSNVLSFENLNLNFSSSGNGTIVQESKKDTSTPNPGSSSNTTNNSSNSSSASNSSDSSDSNNVDTSNVVLSDTINNEGALEIDLNELLNDTEKFIWQTVHNNDYLIDNMYSNLDDETGITTITAVIFCENDHYFIDNFNELLSAYVSGTSLQEEVVITFEDISKDEQSYDRVLLNTNISTKGGIEKYNQSYSFLSSY
ncbi:MAG: hypothetical protein R3Y29_02015 [bacterium]